MTDTNSTTRVVQDAQANLELAEALHGLGHWIATHAGDLPKIQVVAWISDFRLGGDPREVHARARGELTALARALGERAVEKQMGSRVRVSGAFGPIDLHAEASIHELRDGPPPEPDYEPIIDRDDNRPASEQELMAGYGLAVHADEIARRRVPHALKRDLGIGGER